MFLSTMVVWFKQLSVSDRTMKLKRIAAIGLLAAAPGAALAAPAINGAGATFPAPIYQRWFQDYAGITGDRVNYQSVGSGAVS